LKGGELVIKISQGDERQPWSVVKKKEGEESYAEIEEHQLDIAEGDAYKSIKEVWVAAISAVENRANSSAKAEEKLREAEGSNQQFREEWIKCSRVQWKSEENKSCLQQQIEIQETIDELWNLRQISKNIYSKMKEAAHCKEDWEVQKSEG